jgi:hypothetical protein
VANDEEHAGLAPQSSNRPAFGTEGRRDFLKHTVLLGAAAAVGPMPGAGAAHAPGKQAIQSIRGKEMRQRRLGTMKVSEIGAGCMEFAGNYNTPSQRNRRSGRSARRLKTA